MGMRIGVNPLCWVNSDVPDLEMCHVEHCLSEIALLGIRGIELEEPLRRRMDQLETWLGCRGLNVVAAWHSTHLLLNPIAGELERLDSHLKTLGRLGGTVVNLAECTAAVHQNQNVPLSERPVLNEDQWESLCEGLETLHQHCAERGFQTAYHPHMGTAVQTADDVQILMDGTKNLGLLFDPGHLAFAESDPMDVLLTHGRRVTHVHAKNVRVSRLGRHLDEDSAFIPALLDGVFTVPGDNGPEDDDGLDFLPMIQHLAHIGFDGWVMLEAEQDPSKANPFFFAQLGVSTLQYLVKKVAMMQRQKTKGMRAC